MARIKVTSQNIDTKANTWLNNNPSADSLVFYDEGFKYPTDELIRLAFTAGHIIKIVPLEGKLKEVQYVSALI